MHYVNTAFDFFGNCLLEKRKFLMLLNHDIFAKSNKNKVLLISRSFSFSFLEDKKLKKLAVALTLLIVLSLKSNIFYSFCLLVKICLHCINLQSQGTTLNHL